MSMWWTYWTRRGENKLRSCKPRCQTPSIRPIKRCTSSGSSTSTTVLGRTACPCHLEAFLSYWLSYFIFPSLPEDRLNSFVFPMVVLLAQKKLLALEPWYLGGWEPSTLGSTNAPATLFNLSVATAWLATSMGWRRFRPPCWSVRETVVRRRLAWDSQEDFEVDNRWRVELQLSPLLFHPRRSPSQHSLRPS